MAGLQSELRLRLISGILRGLIGALFILAGVSKLSNPAAFASSISNYGLLPDELLRWASLGIPWTEVVFGGALFKGQLSRAASGFLILLLFLFSGIILYAWWGGLPSSCSCFGGWRLLEGSHSFNLGRNLILVLINIIIFRLSNEQT